MAHIQSACLYVELSMLVSCVRAVCWIRNLLRRLLAAVTAWKSIHVELSPRGYFTRQFQPGQVLQFERTIDGQLRAYLEPEIIKKRCITTCRDRWTILSEVADIEFRSTFYKSSWRCLLLMLYRPMDYAFVHTQYIRAWRCIMLLD